ncbi:MAG: hypothetical protein K6E27_03335 [Eubacterium sp.]|nr:hypothetical protein [Eubacterium sp.]
MKIKDSLKMLKYTQNYVFNIIAIFLFLGTGLITSFPVPLRSHSVLGAFWANYLSGYLVAQITAVTFSGVIQSSESFKKMMTKNMSIIILICNMISFVFFCTLRTVLAYMLGVEENLDLYLISFMIFQVLEILCVAVLYKIMVLGIFCAIPLFSIVLFSTWDGFDKIGLLCSDPKILVAMAFVTCLLTPLMYYGVSMALYKKPYVGKFGRLVYNTK